MISSFELLHRAEFESRQGLLGKPQLWRRTGSLSQGGFEEWDLLCLEHLVGQLGQEFSSGTG